jgi:thiosulfate reductase cytochrome b subunit
MFRVKLYQLAVQRNLILYISREQCSSRQHHNMTTHQHSVEAKRRHPVWVRSTHWIITLAFFALVYSGVEILMVHPRLYWGESGNDLTPAILELPISRNFKHHGFQTAKPFFASALSPVSAARTYDIFNQNGWGRSLHFLAAWFLVLTGCIYLLFAAFSGHIKYKLWPAKNASTQLEVAETREQVRLTNGNGYGLLQRWTYLVVIFFLLPLTAVTGLTMSPAITAAYPFLLRLFFGGQSARTIHFFASTALVIFLIGHVAMVIRSGFRKQMKDMTIGA